MDAETAGATRKAGAFGAALIAAALLLAGLSLPAAADPVPGNDSDAISIALSPIADVGVDIDTAAVSLDFSLNMGATAYTQSPATVTILGNIQPQELDIYAQNVSGAPVWSLDADETAGADQLQLYALFATGRQTPPSEANFAGAKNLITTAPKRAGQQTGAAADGNFENNSMSGDADMDNILLISPERQLWLRLDTPPLTSTEQTQSIQIVITATRSNL